MEETLPVSTQAPEAPRVGAGWGVRAGAQVVDLMLHNLIGLGVGVVVGIMIGLYSVITGTPADLLSGRLNATGVGDYIFALLGYVLYHTICEGMHGATLGKLIFKLHVLDEAGSAISIGPAIARSLAFYIDSLFFGLIAFLSMRSSPLQQRIGDQWAKTVVVQRSTLPSHLWPSAGRFVIAFLIGVTADGLMFVLSLLVKLV